MKSSIFFVLCILGLVSPRDAVAGLKSNSAISSPTKSQKTPLSRTAVPKSGGKVPTSYLTHKSHSTTSFPITGTSQKRPPSQTRVLKSSGKVPTAGPKTSVRPTIRTTSSQKPISPSSRPSYPTSTKTQKPSAPPTLTTAKTTATQNSTRTKPLVSVSKTLTVSNGQTASAQVGWIVVGAGVGGAVVVGGNILPVEGGTEVII